VYFVVKSLYKEVAHTGCASGGGVELLLPLENLASGLGKTVSDGLISTG
jgi:hypothetical protein